MTTRTKTKKIKLKNIIIGGSKKIVIQSMTNTKTSDVNATIEQINALVKEGAEIVRVAVFDNEDSLKLKEVILKAACPIVADIHFNPQFAINAIRDGVSKIRLNPGNIAKEEDLLAIIKEAKIYNTAIRIGVNSGSIPLDLVDKYGVTKKSMFLAMKRYVQFFEDQGFTKLVLSLKASYAPLAIESYRLAAKEFSYPLHLGITEAGPIEAGTIKSCAGLAPLLYEGIGDTIRISLTGDPVEEVKVCKKLLNALGLYSNVVNIISCPTCGRLNFDMEPLIKEIEEYTKEMQFPLKIAVLGCIVNGIGESKEADIGVAGSINKGIIFEKGKILKTVNEKDLAKELKALIDKYYQEYKKNNNLI
ncbi:MAG: flavodoxin-dependent (E)-4-hydroxy-3-methylbut-2-enyl-diphosphate synthase [Mycoplasmoidaceae bacterium]